MGIQCNGFWGGKTGKTFLLNEPAKSALIQYLMMGKIQICFIMCVAVIHRQGAQTIFWGISQALRNLRIFKVENSVFYKISVVKVFKNITFNRCLYQLDANWGHLGSTTDKRLQRIKVRMTMEESCVIDIQKRSSLHGIWLIVSLYQK